MVDVHAVWIVVGGVHFCLPQLFLSLNMSMIVIPESISLFGKLTKWAFSSWRGTSLSENFLSDSTDFGLYLMP